MAWMHRRSSVGSTCGWVLRRDRADHPTSFSGLCGNGETHGHDVAIKVISSKYIADADALSRFEREARLMARIRHPNIVHQYELRRLHGGHVALVMQYVRGESLITILRRRGKLRFDESVQIL